MTQQTVSGYARLRAAGSYLGLLPLLIPIGRRAPDPFHTQHARQAAVLFGALLVLVTLFLTAALGLSYLLVHYRDIYQDYQLERHILGTLRKLFLAWLVFWGFGLALAALGSLRPMPLVRRLTGRPWARGGGILFLALLYVLLAILVPVALHAEHLAPAGQEGGTLYFVYEDNGLFPRWFFQLAFYPMTRTATALWGDGSVVVERFTRDAVFDAVAHGRVIYLGTHGTGQGLMLHDGWLAPADLAAVPINPQLQFVYISGCDSGQQRDGWVAAFAPAEVVTYDRLSAVLEHAWWLWFRGPDKLRSLEKEFNHARQ